MMSAECHSLLFSELSPHWARIHQPMLLDILKGYTAWRAQGNPVSDTRMALLQYLSLHVYQTQERLNQLHRAASSFASRHSRAGTDEERREHILGLARALGQSPRGLRADEQAFSNWFGADAVRERYQRRAAREERRLALCLERFAQLAYPLLRQEPDRARRLWRDLDIHRVLLAGLQHNGEARVRLAAFEALDRLLHELPAAQTESLVGQPILQLCLRSAVDWHGSVWLQAAALSVLSRISLDWFCRAVRRRFAYNGPPDEMFLRARAVQIMCRVYVQSPEVRGLIAAAARDNAAHVRQTLAMVLPRLPDEAALNLLPVLAQNDSDPAVRAAALLSLVELQDRPELRPMSLAMLAVILKTEQDDFVLRVALQVVGETHARLMHLAPDMAQLNVLALREHIDHLHQQHPSLPLRRQAAATREQLWAQATPERAAMLATLREQLGPLRCGASIVIASALPVEELARLLAVLGQNDCGFEILPQHRGYRLRKHDRFRWRLWRVLHETRHPASDKRQAFSHSIGRHYSGRWQAQSSIMAEMSETKVPAEPLVIDAEGGWRPYLPLLDQVISACGVSGQPMRLFSSEGLTEIVPPSGLLGRLGARLRVSWQVAELSRLRNWSESSRQPASAYVEALGKLGIGLRYTPYAAADAPPAADPKVGRFFAPSLAILPPQLLSDFAEYFVSLYQNSLRELIGFLGAMSVLFFGRHLWINQRIRHYRSRMPLVIGGWGTRGKSGSERLKAALFNALGFNLVSKTTGCEAMFVHGHAYGQPREMFLFRPYDKASIWEQVDVMRIAEKLGCEVFLWECMALTPSFVYTLQREWMRDDLATICNAYPDHEDLQGPAGINISQVMQNFVPRAGTLITTEEQMLPMLRQEAHAVGTRSVEAGWLQAGLITRELQARFPYQEHPYNLALICALAEELGVARDFALKEMADNVIPDLGVLKAFPIAPIRGRRLEFIMGMSANERLGCMSNWRRMGFASHDPATSPGIWTSSVINNRADRTARSQVFAAIVIKDLSADRHVLIGTNLDGFRAYMREAYAEFAESLSLWPSGSPAMPPEERLAQHARARRIPTSRADVAGRLAAMLSGLGATLPLVDAEALLEPPEQLEAWLKDVALEAQAAAIRAQVHNDLDELASFTRLADAVRAQSQPSEELDRRFRQQLWEWIDRHLIVIENPLSSGEQVIETICAATPPGFLNRIMGLQNIKGTGLGFVYAWQAWDACARACAQLLTACWDDAPETLRERLERYRPQGLRANDYSQAELGLRTLNDFQEFNPLCEDTVRAVCALVMHSPAAQSELFQADIRSIITALDRQLAMQRARGGETGQPGPYAVLLKLIESFLDAGDAIKRRRTANRLYQALCSERIGSARAALELQLLTKRQKGGWFVRAAQETTQRIAQQLRAWFTFEPGTARPEQKGEGQ